MPLHGANSIILQFLFSICNIIRIVQTRGEVVHRKRNRKDSKLLLKPTLFKLFNQTVFKRMHHFLREKRAFSWTDSVKTQRGKVMKRRQRRGCLDEQTEGGDRVYREMGRR